MDYLDLKAYRYAAWAGIGLLAVGEVVVLARGQWQAGLILGIFMAASLAFMLVRNRLPALFDLLFVLAAVINAAGWVWDLFERIWLYDEVAHTLTSFTVALTLGFLAYYSVRVQFREHGIVFALIIACLGVAIGAWWEVFEYVTNTINDLPDTILDLVLDTVGALAAGAVNVWVLRREPVREQRSGSAFPQELPEP